jgi:hypothetical protein
MTDETASATYAPTKAPLAFTLPFGLGLIAVLEALLLADVRWSRRAALHAHADILALAAPADLLHGLARWVAVNFTVLVWPAYVIFLDGLLIWQSGASPVRQRRHHFAMLCIASVLLWCLFDLINFYGIRAWTYIGMPPQFASRAWGYVLAFGSIAPAMLLSGQVFLNAVRRPPTRLRQFQVGNVGLWVSGAAGASMLGWPLVQHNPATNLTLWTGFIFLLDPINYARGRPSFFGDIERANFYRPAAAMLGGLVCGLLWEFWNYWALAKWTYHLPFLGTWEQIRYFEMPLPGLLGFLPFGLAIWVMWQALRIPLEGLVEDLPDDHALL